MRIKFSKSSKVIALIFILTILISTLAYATITPVSEGKGFQLSTGSTSATILPKWNNARVQIIGTACPVSYFLPTNSGPEWSAFKINKPACITLCEPVQDGTLSGATCGGCSKTCGGGTRTCTKTCVGVSCGGGGCSSGDTYSEACNTQACVTCEAPSSVCIGQQAQCSDGTTRPGTKIPSCSSGTDASLCVDASRTASDGCGRTCTFTGTKTTGSCAKCEAPSSVCIGQQAQCSDGSTKPGTLNCASAGTCFSSDTQILMADGTYKNIEEINSGDKVVSYDEKNKQFVTSIVGDLMTHNGVDSFKNDFAVSPLLELTVQAGDKVLKTKVTNNHPYYSSSYGKYKQLFELNVGDDIKTIYGNGIILSKEALIDGSSTEEEKSTVVYNLEMAVGPKSYLANNAVVHNGGGGDTGGTKTTTPTPEPTPQPTTCCCPGQVWDNYLALMVDDPCAYMGNCCGPQSFSR